MGKNKIVRDEFNQLRAKAEKAMIKNGFKASQTVSDDPLKLLYELQTFQIELEMQNEELRISQQVLIKSQKKYTELYDFAPVGYITISSKGLILESNLTFTDMLAMERIAIINQPLSAHVFFDDQDIYYQYCQDLSVSKTRQVCELRLQKEDGKPLNVQLESTIILDEDGDPLQYRTIVIDISAQKIIEKEKEKFESHLCQIKKLETIGDLAGGIAHDFNNILFIILGNVELALKDTPEKSPVYSKLERIRTAGMRASDVVQLLLNYSRKTDLELKPIKILTIIQDAVKLLRSTMPATIDIQEHFLVTDATIIADSIQINQVMMNICINAFQEMEQSGGVIEIYLDIVSLGERAVKIYPDLMPGDYVKIIVTDTGRGIDPEIIDRIFDPYFTTREIGAASGVGLGLSVVLGIVKNHGGTITLDSQPGKGTTFTMLFPSATKKASMEIKMSEKNLPCGNETILFVDDESSITDMFRDMLERLGYRVEAKTDPEEALLLFKSKPDYFDAVITDMIMPKMTGEELIVKLLEIRSDIHIILCTGHNSLIDEERAIRLGVAGYILKPVSILKIAETIRNIFDKPKQ